MSEVRANSSTIAYQHETTTSRLKKRTDAIGQEANYEYFLDGALKRVSYTNATISTPTVSFTYDTNHGRTASMTDGLGTTTKSYHAVGGLRTPGSTTDTWGYDALGRLTSQVDPIGTFGLSWDWKGSHGDDPDDQIQIELGFKYYRMGCYK